MEIVKAVFNIQRRHYNQSVHLCQRAPHVGLKLQISQLSFCSKLKFTMILSQLQVKTIVIVSNIIIVVKSCVHCLLTKIGQYIFLIDIASKPYPSIVIIVEPKKQKDFSTRILPTHPVSISKAVIKVTITTIECTVC